MKRRGFLKRSMYFSLMVLASLLPLGLSRVLNPKLGFDRRNLLRPPGALAKDAEFIAACIGCGLCGEVCPPKCIRFYTQSGGSLQQTPYIDPKTKGCTLCSECMKVCPTNALSLVERNKVRMGVAKIDRVTCYPWVDKGVCGACVSICPLGDKAIRFKHGNIYRPYVVKTGCVGCGLCVEVCPYPGKAIAVYRHEEKVTAKTKTGSAS